MTGRWSFHDHLISSLVGGHLLKQWVKISICGSEAVVSRSARQSSLRITLTRSSQGFAQTILPACLLHSREQMKRRKLDRFALRLANHWFAVSGGYLYRSRDS
jgi:hypothetical protein